MTAKCYYLGTLSFSTQKASESSELSCHSDFIVGNQIKNMHLHRPQRGSLSGLPSDPSSTDQLFNRQPLVEILTISVFTLWHQYKPLDLRSLLLPTRSFQLKKKKVIKILMRKMIANTYIGITANLFFQNKYLETTFLSSQLWSGKISVFKYLYLSLFALQSL